MLTVLISTVVFSLAKTSSFNGLLYLLQSPLTKSKVPNLKTTFSSNPFKIILMNLMDLKSLISFIASK